MTGRYPQRLAVGLEEPLKRTSPPDAGLPPDHPTVDLIPARASHSRAATAEAGVKGQRAPLPSWQEPRNVAWLPAIVKWSAVPFSLMPLVAGQRNGRGPESAVIQGVQMLFRA